MGGILHKAFDQALRLVDAFDDLVAEAALGFGAAAPMIADQSGDALSEPNPATD